MNIRHAKQWLVRGVFIGLSSTGLAREEEFHVDPPDPSGGVSGSLSLGWESRYVLEGRDLLDGDGLLVASFEFSWESLVFGAWIGESTGQSYDELNLNLAFVREWGDFEVYAMYNHLRFFNDDAHDHELGLGCAWSGAPWDVVVGLDAYYSFDASGSFVEVFAERGFELCERLVLTPGLVLGCNQGFVADGHRGLNHIAARLEADYQLFGGLYLEAHATYSWALGREVLRPGDANLRDFGHAGAAVRWEF